MTHAEWMDAFRRGDPDALGTSVLACIREAYDRMVNHAEMVADVPDIGELRPGFDRDHVHPFCVQVATVMREHGLLYQLPPGGTS